MKVEIEQADKFENDTMHKMIEEGKKGGRMSESDKDSW